MDEQPIRLDRVCRGCLREEAQMQPLFQQREPRLNQMLVCSTQLQVSENDGLPCQICVHCTNQLSSAFTFKKMCERSDERLRRYVSQMKSSTIICNSSLNVPASIKQEGIIQNSTKNELLDFNSMFNSDGPSIVKIEHEMVDGHSSKQEMESKNIIRSSNEAPLNLINSNEKCTQTQASDFLQKVFSCFSCTKKFSSIIGVSNHMKSHHGVNDITTCKDCDKIFTTFKEFKQHSLNVHGKYPRSETSSAMFSCEICKKSFTHLNHLKHHMPIHGKKKIYNCQNCSHGFNKLGNFEKHKTKCVIKSVEIALQVEESHGTNEVTKKIKDDQILEKDSNNQTKSRLSVDVTLKDNGDNADIHIKEEPLEELLEEAEREQDMDDDDDDDDDDMNSVDNDNHSIDGYDDLGKDSSESEDSVKVHKKRGRPPKEKHPTNYDLNGYMKKHKEKGLLYSCVKCPELFKHPAALKRHELDHIKGRIYKCDLCDKEFTGKVNLKKHKWQHVEERPHKCDECSKSFTTVDHLKRHKAALHSDKKKNVKSVFCNICNRGFTTEKYMEIHMRLHTGQKAFACSVCNKGFSTKWHLKEHSKWHSTEKPFLCSVCGQRFIRNDYLITHMRRHKGEKPYKCKYCNKGFPRATDLTVHERYHTGEKTHLCTICGKGFTRQYNLTVHLRIHTGEKPYVCSYCNRRFAQGNDLKSHVRRHTGERFNCEICGDGFIQGYHLTQHKRSVHGLQCDSHIRRVEKHPKVNPENSQEAQSLLSNKESSTRLESIKDQTESESHETSGVVEGQNSQVVGNRCNDNESATIPHDISLQSQVASMQTSEAGLIQRAHIVPALMPIVPVAIFPPMHSRI